MLPLFDEGLRAWSWIAQFLNVRKSPGIIPNDKFLGGEQRQQLSERDLEILRLLGEGRSFTEIAASLGLGYKTVANTATAIKSKLGVARTADLIRLSVEMGIAARFPEPCLELFQLHKVFR